MMTFWPRFSLAVLAAWRVTHLLAKEDGPGDLIVRLRARLGRGLLGKFMDCFGCLSMWVAIPFAFFVADTALERLVAWLAIAGASCLLDRLGIESPPVSIFQQEGGQHAMLRSEEAAFAEPHQADPQPVHHASNGSSNVAAIESRTGYPPGH